MADSPWADPGKAGEQLALEDFPTFLFVRLASVMQRDITTGYLEQFDLSTTQWRVLAALSARAPISFSDLVKMTTSDKALVSRTLRSLAERDLARVDADPDHGRKAVCIITAKGRALYRRVLPKAQAAQARILDLLERDERVALHAALTRLRAALDPAQLG